MIIGTGSDLIDIDRIEKTLARHGQRFIDRCFTPVEIAKAERRRGAGTHIATYAKRFAAKEACSKALGTGFADGVYFKDIGVVNDPSGRPTLHLTGGAQDRLMAMIPPGMKAVIHLTLTDEPPLAQAYVIIEAV
jgi:holo-[acyl-carrier protein] synthase